MSDHLPHHDPAVCELIRQAQETAWAEGWENAWSPMSMHNRDDGPNPYSTPTFPGPTYETGPDHTQGAPA